MRCGSTNSARRLTATRAGQSLNGDGGGTADNNDNKEYDIDKAGAVSRGISEGGRPKVQRRLIRLKDIIGRGKRIEASRSWYYAKVAEGLAPKPVKSGSISFFYEDEIDDFVERIGRGELSGSLATEDERGLAADVPPPVSRRAGR